MTQPTMKMSTTGTIDIEYILAINEQVDKLITIQEEQQRIIGEILQAIHEYQEELRKIYA